MTKVTDDEEKKNQLLANDESQDDDGSDIEPFTMTIKQLKRPALFILYLYCLAVVIFLAEYIVHKWKDWRDRKLVLSKFKIAALH